MTTTAEPLSWTERRVMYRIEAEQELTRFRGFFPKLGDLAALVGVQPKECREVVSGLVEKGYLEFGATDNRKVRFVLIKPLGGQYRLQWAAGESELVRAF
jgi:DNA-binding MarR family transcriptional regulator